MDYESTWFSLLDELDNEKSAKGEKKKKKAMLHGVFVKSGLEQEMFLD